MKLKPQPLELPAPPEAYNVLATLPRGDLLLGYQQRAVRAANDNSLLVVEKSRRIGLTWGFAAHAVLTASSQRAAGGMDALYISYGLEMTREFIDACAMWAKSFNIAAGEVGEFLFDDLDEHGKTRAIQAFRIKFASGFEIIALSGKPRNLRGKQGLLIIDEAAFVDDLAELLKAAMAFTIWGGKVVVISTHDGADNPFNQLVDDIKAGRRKGAVVRITFDDALKDGLYERICLVGGKAPTPEGKQAFIDEVRGFYGDDAGEELDCIPRTGSGSLISPELVVAAQHAEAGKPEFYSKGLCVIGRDVARRRDLAVIWCFELVGNVLWLRERHEEQNMTFAAQDVIFDGMFANYRILRAGVDQTGMGEKVVEDAKGRHGDRVEGVLFTGPNRLDMALALLKRFQDGTIRIPDDAAIRTDFRAIKRSKGKGDTVRLVNEGTVHADMFWAAALAALMAEAGAYEIDFMSTGDERVTMGGAGAAMDIDEDEGFGVVRSGNDEMGDFV